MSYLLNFIFNLQQKNVVAVEEKERAHNLGSEDQLSVSAFMVRAFLSRSHKMLLKKPITCGAHISQRYFKVRRTVQLHKELLTKSEYDLYYEGVFSFYSIFYILFSWL